MNISPLDPAARIQQLQQHEQSEITVGKKATTGEEQQNEDFTEQESVTKEQLATAVDQANKTMENFRTNLNFKLHEKSGEYVVQVVNSENKEVIREIPPEWVLDMVAHFREMVGIMVDEIV